MGSLKEIRFRPRFGDLIVPGADDGIQPASDGNIHARVAELNDISITSLIRELNRLRVVAYETDTLWLYLYDVESPDFWPEVTPYDPVSLKFYGDRVRVCALVKTGKKQLPNAYLAQVLQPLMRRSRMAVVGTTYHSGLGTDNVEVKMEPMRIRGRRVAELVQIGRDAITLTESVLKGGEFGPGVVRDLVASGRTDLLLGQPESDRFDAKSDLGRPRTDRARFELAKDVAAFANTGQEAIVVIGLKTRKRGGQDVVSSAVPKTRDIGTLSAIRGVLSSWLFPAPTGLRVRAVGPQRSFALIEIPAQPPEVLPVMVRRATLAGTFADTQFTIPERLGAETVYWDAGRLHSLIAAGRGALGG